ncbi:NAD-P-binding protein [Lentinula lateritia]|uniref:NAD-P-binding protein n=1 Tax=Lentinula lateritia TaxID=40482 RepID=A0ABQ8UYY4_9AGAR|nr:NAD-P-binding protein [Lentinula lateritia]
MGITLADVYQFFKQAYFSGKPVWQTSDIPDLSGKVVIVTGGNAGIGKETVKALLEHNAIVYIATRNSVKAESAINELKAMTGREAYYLHLDLQDLLSIKSAVIEFQNQQSRLDILFNNAGVMMPPIEATTTTGYDLSFATNVLGHFYLSKLLLPIMIQTAQNTATPSRIVNTSSGSHYLAMYDFNTFKDGPLRRKLSLMQIYGQSKWANVTFSNELARRYYDQGIVSCAVNPGNLKDTELSRHVHSGIEHFLLKILQIYPPSWGALPQLFAGTSSEGATLNGKFIVPWGHVGQARKDTNDTQLGKALWVWLEDQIRDM